jgi:hypothetical protein
MKLIFYKTEDDEHGRPVARRVMTVEATEARRDGLTPRSGLPALVPALAHWRLFADFFEIV